MAAKQVLICCGTGIATSTAARWRPRPAWPASGTCRSPGFRRNRAYGERLGCGQDPAEALAEMQAAGQTVAGCPTCGLALELAGDLAAAGRLDPGGYPLLRAVGTLLGAAGEDTVGREAGAVGRLLAEACLPPRPSW